MAAKAWALRSRALTCARADPLHSRANSMRRQPGSDTAARLRHSGYGRAEATIASKALASRARFVSARRQRRPSRAFRTSTARRMDDEGSPQTVATTAWTVMVVVQGGAAVRRPGAGSEGVSLVARLRTTVSSPAERNLTWSPSSSKDQSTGYSKATPHRALANVLESARVCVVRAAAAAATSSTSSNANDAPTVTTASLPTRSSCARLGLGTVPTYHWRGSYEHAVLEARRSSRLETAVKLAFRSGRGVAQPGSAPALGAGGRRFESGRPDHFSKSGVTPG